VKPEDFILSIIKAYRSARIPLTKDKRIHRGRSRSISAVAEDLFADFLVSNDKKIQAIYVDQSIYLKSAKKSIYPDITIVRDGIITAFLDLKMDLGWKRNGLVDLCKNHALTIDYAQGTTCSIKDGQTKELHELRISKDVSYGIVIISRRNSGATLDEQIEVAKKIKTLVNVYVLCRNSRKHPNEYGKDSSPEQLVESLDVDTKAFNELMQAIK
jgi:hypothetical protein